MLYAAQNHFGGGNVMPLTQTQLQAAFAAMKWPAAWSFEAAMADPLRSRVVRARAAHMRTQAARAGMGNAKRYVRRVSADGQHWTTQVVSAPAAEQRGLL